MSPLTAVLLATLASPSAGAPPGLPEVTVVAPKPPDAQQIAGDNVRTFVESHGKPGQRTDQLGRWDSAVCASTQGLPKGFNDFVSTRVQAIAAAVHVRLQTRQPCKPNVLIIFTTEPQKLMDDVAARKPRLLGFQYIANIPKVKTMDHPIQAWYVTGSQGTGGVEIDDIWGTQPPRDIGKRLSLGVSSHILFVLVVIDTNKVTDYPIESISDYVAMATLSQTRIIDGCGELPSILDLMAPDCKSEKSEAITGGDMAYLRALYSIDMRKELFLQRAEIENRMMQEFAGRGRPFRDVLEETPRVRDSQ